jgi:hypothetical protein
LVSVATWPIVLIACPERFDASWVQDLGRKVDAVFARNERFAILTDTSRVREMPSARERRALGEWAARPDQVALQKRLNVGSATVVASPLLRGGLQAIYWLWTPPNPQYAARDFGDGWRWCLGQLAGARIAPPAMLDAERVARRELAL